MPVKVLHVVLLVLIGGLISSLPLEDVVRHPIVETDCGECSAGNYLSSCKKCSQCPSGTYTNQINTEHSCHPCNKDCRAAYNMQVEKPCSRVSNLVCRCMDGFLCTETDDFTNQCSSCEPKRHTPKQTTSTQIPSTQMTSTQTPSTWVPSTKSTYTTTSSAALQRQEPHNKKLWIPIVVVFGILSSVFTFGCYLCRQSEIDCFKQWVKRCSIANQKEGSNTASSEIKEPIKENNESYQHASPSSSANSDCPAHKPTSTEQPLPNAGNLGPLHIYGAGTVFVSLLNQFGLNGGEKEEECLRQQHIYESELYSPTSPTFPLSTEERTRDSGYISFPSQEQGKECHMSKEEGL